MSASGATRTVRVATVYTHTRPDQTAASVETLRRIGDRVERGELLARLHLAADDPAAVARAARCFTLADGAPQRPQLVLERVD